VNTSLISEVDRLSGQQVELCYHCHKCTAGCPVVSAMAYGPDHILRMVALGQDEAIYASKDIWLCAGCYNCATHCPNEIDISAVMDALRQLALAGEHKAAERDVLLFHKLFVGVIKRLGRSHEAASLGLFKVFSKQPLLNDMGAGAGLFLRGKIKLLPERIAPWRPSKKG